MQVDARVVSKLVDARGGSKHDDAKGGIKQVDAQGVSKKATTKRGSNVTNKRTSETYNIPKKLKI